MKTFEKRTITYDELKNLCTKNQWYTIGTTKEFNNFLAQAEKTNLTAQDIGSMAYDIAKHSITEDTINMICFEIARKCTSTFATTEN